MRTALLSLPLLGQWALTPYDPGGEIKPLPLDGRLVGRENIEYQTSPSGADLVSLCVTVGAIAGRDAPPMPRLVFASPNTAASRRWCGEPRARRRRARRRGLDGDRGPPGLAVRRRLRRPVVRRRRRRGQVRARSVSGDIEHTDGTRYSYRVVDEELADEGTAGAAGLAMRYLFHGPVLYVGAEMGMAHVDTRDPARKIDPDSGAMLEPHVGGAVTFAGVFGARTFTAPFGDGLPLSLGAEVAGGTRGIQVVAESRHGSCVVEDTQTFFQPMVEVRARADVWVSPRIAIGGYGGADVLSGSPSGGVIVSAHWRAFDGAR